MSKPVVVYFDIQDFQPASLEYLRQLFDLRILPDPTQGSPEIWAEAHALFAPMGYRWDAETLGPCRRLGVIGTPTTGIPHIDADYAQARNIVICSLRDQQEFLRSITPTAELTWGMLLCLTRFIPQAMDMVLAGQWNGKYFGHKTPRMLSQMSLGVVGLGRLGSLVACYGRAFCAAVRYFDPYVENPAYQRCGSLQELASQSDIVSLHVHSTPETRGMIDRGFFQALPRGSFFLNTARGDLVDESALLQALESGHLAGAALDTLDGEHLPGFAEKLAGHPLLTYARSHDNLLLTPHYGGSTRDAWEKTEKRIIDLMIAALKSRHLL